MNSRNRTQTEGESGRFSYDGLERVIHEKARLGILTSLLSQHAGLVFSDLKALCSLTDGNLNRHLKVLEEDGLVELWKGGRGKRPQTLCRLSENGRSRFLEYLAELERVIADASAAAKSTPSRNTTRGFREGWSPA